MDASRPQRLKEVASLFLKLGFTAFGGPAAHTALMHTEIVQRRKWLTDQEFLDLLGATNIIPGPNSTEMAIHVGFLRAGWPGLLAGGLCFLTPAMVMIVGLAWAYVRFGSMPQAQWLLYGIKPVVIAIIVQAVWNLGRKAARTLFLAVCGLIVLGLVLPPAHQRGRAAIRRRVGDHAAGEHPAAQKPAFVPIVHPRLDAPVDIASRRAGGLRL